MDGYSVEYRWRPGFWIVGLGYLRRGQGRRRKVSI